MTDRTLARAMECLHPVQARLVIVGGTAHRLFPLHALGSDPGFPLLTTEDVDIAAPLELGHDGGRELFSRLQKAGFQEELRGADDPAHLYRLSEDGESYLQFIAPLTGSGTRRDGKQDQVLRFSGIHAEKLRHVDIMLNRPWTATVSVEGGQQSFQVVNPVAYLAQKLLCLPKRRDKRGKDLLYVFDTLAVFGANLDELGAQAVQLVPHLSANTAKEIRRTAQELCFVENDVSLEAAAIAIGQRRSPPRSAQIVAACRLGLERVLGSLIPGL